MGDEEEEEKEEAIASVDLCEISINSLHLRIQGSSCRLVIDN